MNRILRLSLAFVLGLTACKPFDPALLNPQGPVFSPKLPALEKEIENNLVVIVNQSGQAFGANPRDIATLFDREVSEIITDPYSDKKGFIILKVSNVENRAKIVGPLILGAFTAGLAYLFGVPTGIYFSTVEVQIDLMNGDRKLIGSYRGFARKKIRTGPYSKESYMEAARVAYLLAAKNAIQDAKSKMIPDITRLNDALNK